MIPAILSALVSAPSPIISAPLSFPVTGSPGNVVVWSESGFVIGADKSGIAVAAAVDGPARILALGHNGYFSTWNQLQAKEFFSKGVRWTARSEDPTVFVVGNLAIGKDLALAGFSVQTQSAWKAVPGAVTIVDAHDITAQDIPKIRQYLADGGGLVTAATGWGWQMLNPAKRLTEFNGNLVLRPYGIGFGGNFCEPEAGNKFTFLPTDITAANSGYAWRKLMQKQQVSPSEGNAALALLSALPSTDPYLKPKIAALGDPKGIQITEASPLTSKMARERTLVAVHHQQIVSGDITGASPFAASFPGSVDRTIDRISKTVVLDETNQRWQSTGLYAAPGEVITIQTSSKLADGKSLAIQIGCHTDALWGLNKWTRFPEVSQNTPVNAPNMKISSSFGGLIYVDVKKPLGASGQTVRITGGVEALHYVLGKTSYTDWEQQRVRAKAPWAEIETRRMVITVPVESARNVADPRPVALFWDRVADATAELATINKNRGFKERYVADRQISAGYMHSGYPIMTWLDVRDMVVDARKLQAEGSWGHFHEIGHNHQNSDWTFEGTGEVTVNLFTLYSFDTVVGKRPADRTFDPESCLKVYRAFANGGTFEKWKDDPFVALTMYAQLQNEFGWEAYKAVFAEYLTMPKERRPKTDQDKRDLWMVTFSQYVGLNLRPFFEAWKVPTRKETLQEIGKLPVWMPKGM